MTNKMNPAEGFCDLCGLPLHYQTCTLDSEEKTLLARTASIRRPWPPVRQVSQEPVRIGVYDSVILALGRTDRTACKTCTTPIQVLAND